MGKIINVLIVKGEIEMKKNIALYAAAAMLVTAVSPVVTMAQETVVAAPTTPATLQETADATIKAFAPMLGAPSIQYAVMDAGEVVLSGDTSLTADTMYGIGSVSKVYTAAAVMQLVDQGLIDLDEPLTTYIPEFVMADARYVDITPRMLLNHSSGLMGSTFNNGMLYNDNDTYATAHLLEELKTQRLKANPGEFSVYCNDGFTLAEILVEHVSGVSFTEYIHTYITAPLALDHTKTPIDTVDAKLFAPIYKAGTTEELPREMLNVIGAGGIYSTAEELCQFGTLFVEDNEILSEEMTDLMAVPEYKTGIWPETDVASFAYGLGWDNVNAYPFSEYDIQALVKGGDTLAYHASLVVIPEYDLTAAVLSSGGASPYNQMIATDLLTSVLMEKGIIKEEVQPTPLAPPVAGEKMPAEYLEYAGSYGMVSGVMKIEITPDGQLTLGFPEMEGMPVQVFTYVGDGSFVFSEGGMALSFAKESNGHTYIKADSIMSVPGLGTMVTSEYQGQKLEAVKVDPKVMAVWEARNDDKYYVVNEKYSSIIYGNMSAALVKLNKNLPGYIYSNKMVDANNAENVLQIPGMYGRDLADLHFYQEDGLEFLKQSGSIYMHEDGVGNFDATEGSTYTIGEKGYAAWYNITSADAGKTITVDVPKEASFSVYTSEGQLVSCSEIDKSNKVVLPENGMIVFASKAGTTFTLGKVEAAVVKTEVPAAVEVPAPAPAPAEQEVAVTPAA